MNLKIPPVRKAFLRKPLVLALTIAVGSLAAELVCTRGAIAQTLPKPTGVADVSVSVKPSIITFNAKPGETVVRPLTIINTQSEPLQVQLTLSDWLRDSTGGHIYSPAGTLPHSLSRWIALGQSFVEVPPNSTSVVDVRLTVPDADSATTRMRWAMIFAEYVREASTSASKTNEVKTQIIRKQKIGIHVYFTPANLTKKAFVLTDMKLVTKDKKKYFRLSCKNTGMLAISCGAFLEFTGQDNDAGTIRVEEIAVPLFPDQYRIIDVAVPQTLKKGKYSVLAALDAGEEIPIEAAQDVLVVE
jgi:hypothetical protein